MRLHEMKNQELDSKLRQFYAEARTKDGQLYSRSSLWSLRNAIERYLNNPPLSKGITISRSEEFKSSNQLLQSQTKLNKRENKENTTSTNLRFLARGNLLKLQNHPWGLGQECLVPHKLILVSPRTDRTESVVSWEFSVPDGRQ